MKQQIQRGLLKLFSLLPDGMLIKMGGGKQIEMGGRKLDPLMHLLWTQGKSQPSIVEFDPVTARQLSAEAFATLNGPPRPGVEIRPMEVGGAEGNLKARLYRPSNARRPAPLMVFFHQGGCVIGDLDTGETFCSIIAERARCLVLSVDYRLAPEHKFPAAAEDAIASFRWAREQAEELGGDSNAMAVAGDSAGGALSAVVTHALKRSGEPQPLLQLLIYPWTTSVDTLPSHETYADAFPLTAPMMDYFGDHYFNNEAERSDWRASPLNAEDFSGLAPAQIITAGFDPISDEGKAYAEKLRQAGTPVAYRCEESLTHSFTAMSGAVPAARRACEQIADDVAKAFDS